SGTVDDRFGRAASSGHRVDLAVILRVEAADVRGRVGDRASVGRPRKTDHVSVSRRDRAWAATRHVLNPHSRRPLVAVHLVYVGLVFLAALFVGGPRIGTDVSDSLAVWRPLEHRGSLFGRCQSSRLATGGVHADYLGKVIHQRDESERGSVR